MEDKGFAPLLLLLGILVISALAIGATLTLRKTPTPIFHPTSFPTITPLPSPTINPTLSPTPTASASANVNTSGTYQNPDLGISFNYPKGWQLIEDAREDNTTIGIEILEPKYDPNIPAPNISLFYQANQKFSQSPPGNSLMTDPQPINVDGVTGIMREDKAALGAKLLPRSGGCPYIEEMQLPLKEGTLTIDSCVVSPDYSSQLQTILESLKFM